MAEFQEVMHQWRRMCDAMGKEYGKDACDFCPVYINEDCACDAIYDIPNDMDWWHTEQMVMEWAAEHPEPVYPTWWEWLYNIGAVARKLKPDVAEMVIDTGLLEPIPADIARKLGIEPKEGI